jgi:hypothetical protein
VSLGPAELWIVVIVGGVTTLSCVLPIAVLLWMAAQYRQSSRLGRRLTELERELLQRGAPDGRAEGLSLKVEPDGPQG